MMRKLIIIPILALFLLTFVSASVYDDFSSGELNGNLWSANGNLDEYYLDTEEGNYHTAQLNSADKYVNLMMLDHEFTVGDVVEYDLNYVSGEGNRMSNIIIDNLELNHYAILVGYWNEVQQSGNDFGTYHFRVEFVENTVNVFVTKPNGETVQINMGNPQINGNSHTFGVGTRTGHNGKVHMDFDNFVINPDEEPQEDNDFEERISALEQQVEELNNRTTLLENLVNEIQERLNNFISEITSYLSFLPRGTKKLMICGYMRENNLDNYSSLGLQCDIRRNNCRCV